METKNPVATGNNEVAVNKDVIKLPPKEFADLPEAVSVDLEKRGCLIPQSYLKKEKHNVVMGEFRQKGQEDVAVLCSKDDSSVILVYWNKSAGEVAEFGNEDNASRIDDSGFGRIISTADEQEIKRYQEEFDGPKPAELNHHGIDDGYGEKGSEIRYFENGRWLVLNGSD